MNQNIDILTLAASLPSFDGHLQLIDARRPAECNPLLPALVHHLDGAPSLVQLKARLLRLYPRDHPATLLGDGEAATRQVKLARLDRRRIAPGIGWLYLPPVAAEEATGSPHLLRAIVHRLRAPGGCPWDREQTPGSLVRFLLEEAYEAADAIEEGDPRAIWEELGDVLLQVYLQAEIAEESGRFDINDVVRSVAEKLVRRHPHVFAGLEVSGAEQVEVNWERLKQFEKGQAESLLDGIPRSAPALARAQEVQRRLSEAGFDWPSKQGTWDKLDEELAELRRARSNNAALAAELGDVLFTLAKLATDAGIDAESALRRAVQRVNERVRYVEQSVAEHRRQLSELSIDEMLGLWKEAKRAGRVT